MYYITFVLLLVSSACTTYSAKILGVFPVASPSHYNLYHPLLQELVKRGHDVTMITAFKEKPDQLYKTIFIPEISEFMQDIIKDMDPFNDNAPNVFLQAIFMPVTVTWVEEIVLSNNQVQDLIKSKKIFDLVIMENVVNDAVKALATHFNSSLVAFSTVGANSFVNPLVGNPSPLSYIPEVSTSFSSQMTFCERLTNCLQRFVAFVAAYYLYTYHKEKQMIQKYIPEVSELTEVSLVLLNSHPSINQPVPYVPNMIDIGGIHIPSPKKLPQDLQNFLDKSKNGVIYFSLGTNVKSSQLPLSKRKALLETFSKLKENVLWKWEEDVLPDQPANVKLSKWLPQNDVLAHPNLKLFITHGGLLSITEAVYHEVPVLAIPIMWDQIANAPIVVQHGFGLALPFKDLNAENLYNSIKELIDNSKYKKEAQFRSQIFNDRLVKLLDVAVYWVEYVIRHKGAPHLRVGGQDLTWYQYHLIDVIIFLFGIAITALAIFFYLSKKVYKKLCSKSETKVKRS